MRYHEISSTMRAFLGAREAFRRLGFRAEDPYCLVVTSAQTGVLSAHVQLRAQCREFVLVVGPVEDEEAFRQEWERVVPALNDGKISRADCDRIWRELQLDRVALIVAMQRKGFVMPIQAAGFS